VAAVATVEVTEVSPGVFDVQVSEARGTTTHRVLVPSGMADDLGLGDVSPDVLVRESSAFLLERESPTSILQEFSLDVIGRYFGEYPDEIRRRLGA
jgi:hypothetical protein